MHLGASSSSCSSLLSAAAAAVHDRPLVEQEATECPCIFKRYPVQPRRIIGDRVPVLKALLANKLPLLCFKLLCKRGGTARRKSDTATFRDTCRRLQQSGCNIGFSSRSFLTFLFLGVVVKLVRPEVGSCGDDSRADSRIVRSQGASAEESVQLKPVVHGDDPLLLTDLPKPSVPTLLSPTR